LSLQSTQVSAVVTDNVSNVIAAINKLEWLHFGCFSYALQLGLQKTISLADILVEQVVYFHSLVKSTNILRQKQQSLQL